MKALLLKQRILSLALMAISSLAILTIFSCSEEENDTDNTVNTDIYYVNYIIQAPGPYGRFSNWTASTPDGTYSNSGYQISSWNQTYGPVEKGFRCIVQIGDYQGGTPSIEIHVSKNNEPFALKTAVTGASALYDID
jgi:hypothetical protein